MFADCHSIENFSMTSFKIGSRAFWFGSSTCWHIRCIQTQKRTKFSIIKAYIQINSDCLSDKIQIFCSSRVFYTFSILIDHLNYGLKLFVHYNSIDNLLNLEFAKKISKSFSILTRTFCGRIVRIFHFAFLLWIIKPLFSGFSKSG